MAAGTKSCPYDDEASSNIAWLDDAGRICCCRGQDHGRKHAGYPSSTWMISGELSHWHDLRPWSKGIVVCSPHQADEWNLATFAALKVACGGRARHLAGSVDQERATISAIQFNRARCMV